MRAAAAAVQGRFPGLSDAEVDRALDSYRIYFREVAGGEDLPPPDALDPATDALLLAIWDTLVDREEDGLDGPAEQLDTFYAAAFADMLAPPAPTEEAVGTYVATTPSPGTLNVNPAPTPVPEPEPTATAEVESYLNTEPEPGLLAEPEETVTGDILQLRITVLGTRPSIWRRVLVPADYDLPGLHHVIQSSVGWDDSKLHEFHLPEEITATASRTLGQVFQEEGTQLLYEYGDTQDNWVHAVVLEQFRERVPGQPYPDCTGGERACPPRSCDNVADYERMLTILADPSHPEHREMAEWITQDFNPSSFNITQAQIRLSRYR